MKHLSKTFLMSATIGAMVAPIIATMACGTSTENYITVGIRPEDQKFWTPIAKQFEKATGKRVKFKWVADQYNNYALWQATKSIPDVTIADSNWAKHGIDKKYFQEIDLKDIAENSKYMISGTDSAYQQKNIKLNGTNFSMNMVNTMKLSSNKYAGFAVIYGPKLIYTFKKFPKKDGSLFDMYDGQAKLHYYVPNKSGTGIEKVNAFENDTSSPLYSQKGHRLKNTFADVQEFITSAVANYALAYNQPPYNYASLTSEDATKRVISTGPSGMSQRVYSAIYSIRQYMMAQTHNGADLKVIPRSSVFSDMAPKWSVLATGDKMIQKTQKQVDDASTNMDKSDSLLEDNVFVKHALAKTNEERWIISKSRPNHARTLTKYMISHYLGSFGYMQTGVVGNSWAMDYDDAQIGFARGKTLAIMDGALWQWGGLSSKIKEELKYDADELLTSFGEPIQITNVDGYSISKRISGARLTTAKKFLRFLMQPKVNSKITDIKAKPTVLGANQFQSKIVGARGVGLENAEWGQLESNQRIQNIDITLAAKTTKTTTQAAQIYGPYETLFHKSNVFDGTGSGTSMEWSIDHTKFVSIIKKLSARYLDDIVGTI